MLVNRPERGPEIDHIHNRWTQPCFMGIYNIFILLYRRAIKYIIVIYWIARRLRFSAKCFHEMYLAHNTSVLMNHFGIAWLSTLFALYAAFEIAICAVFVFTSHSTAELTSENSVKAFVRTSFSWTAHLLSPKIRDTAPCRIILIELRHTAPCRITWKGNSPEAAQNHPKSGRNITRGLLRREAAVLARFWRYVVNMCCGGVSQIAATASRMSRRRIGSPKT